MKAPQARATTAIVGLTTAVSLIVELSGYNQVATVIAGFIPARLSDGVALPPDVFFVPAWLTPITATFLHAGIFHLAMNMLMLGYTARATEQVLGAPAILALYAAGAYAAAGAQWLADPAGVVPMIGASGAASAIIGAYSLLYGQRQAKSLGPIPGRVVQMVWLAAAWTLLNLAMSWALLGQGVMVAGAAHVGGFVVGLVLTRPLLLWRWRKA